MLVTEVNDSGRVRYASSEQLVALDIHRVESAIRSSILQQRHLAATVSCPHDVIQRAGTSFACSATVAGRRYPFEVTETDAYGDVRYIGER